MGCQIIPQQVRSLSLAVSVIMQLSDVITLLPTKTIHFLTPYVIVVIFILQVEATDNLVQEVCKWGCVVMVGPPRSGKTTIITAAIKLFQRQYIHSSSITTSQRTPSTPYKSTTSRSNREREQSVSRRDREQNLSHQEGRQSSSHRPHPDTASTERDGDAVPVDEVDDTTVEVLSSSRQLVDRHVYTLRPQVIIVM